MLTPFALRAVTDWRARGLSGCGLPPSCRRMVSSRRDIPRTSCRTFLFQSGRTTGCSLRESACGKRTLRFGLSKSGGQLSSRCAPTPESWLGENSRAPGNAPLIAPRRGRDDLTAAFPFGNWRLRDGTTNVLLLWLVPRCHRVTAFAVCSKPVGPRETRQFPAAAYYPAMLADRESQRSRRQARVRFWRPHSHTFVWPI